MTAVQHVLTTSKSRPRQMHILARALTDRYGVTFAAVYQESRREWAMDWWDGPTEDEVRGILTRLAAGLPSVTSLRLRRGSTDLGEAVALLLWIEEDPARLPRLSHWNVRESFCGTRFPERSPDAWQRRARHLLTIGTLSSGIEWLRARLWDQALAELDDSTPEQEGAGGRRPAAIDGLDPDLLGGDLCDTISDQLALNALTGQDNTRQDYVRELDAR